MKLRWLFLLLLPVQLIAADVFKELPKLSAYSTDQKIIHWANQFRGLPYGKGGPLGEGKKGRFDQDPLYRFDTFDCTTFVETVTALSLSENKEEFLKHLLSLRYKDGEVSYQTRNHITSQSWLPENTENGYFTESTTSFPGHYLKVASTTIDLPSWYKKHSVSRLKVDGLSKRKTKKRLKELHSLGEKYNSQEVETPYLSIKTVLENWSNFSSHLNGVYVINIVRPNWRMKYKVGTNLNISHQGFLYLKNGVPTMIHASTSGTVVQVSLKKYLGWFKNSSVVKGINLLQINQ